MSVSQLPLPRARAIGELFVRVSQQKRQDSRSKSHTNREYMVCYIEVKELTTSANDASVCTQPFRFVRDREDGMRIDVRYDTPDLFRHRLLNPEVFDIITQSGWWDDQSKTALTASFVKPDHMRLGYRSMRAHARRCAFLWPAVNALCIIRRQYSVVLTHGPSNLAK